MKRITYVIPHFILIITAMYLTFYIIDLFNMMMNFIDNPLTHALLYVFSFLSAAEALLYIAMIIKKKIARWALLFPALLSLSVLGILVLLLVNVLYVAPFTFLMLEPVQIAILVIMLTVSVCSVFMIKIQRVFMTKEYLREKKKQDASK